MFRLHMGETVATQPTVGSNVERVSCQSTNFEVWDLGGQAALRPSWSAYYAATDAVILVVDSTDRARVGVARAELFRLLADPNLAKAAILIFANKQDLPDAMSVAELSEALALVDIKTHSWHVQPSCAITGQGLEDGLKWIVRHVKSRDAVDALT